MLSFARTNPLIWNGMDQLVWIAWLVLGIALIIAEVFTLGFVLLWFGIGAVAAALAGMLGAPFVIQFVIFAVVSVALTAMSRTLFAKYLSHTDENTVKMGMDALARPDRDRHVAQQGRAARRSGQGLRFNVDGVSDRRRERPGRRREGRGREYKRFVDLREAGH